MKKSDPRKKNGPEASRSEKFKKVANIKIL
jgi:hypothetical protein